MIRGASLRAVKNQRTKISGKHKISDDRMCVLLEEFTAYQGDKQRKTLKEGDEVVIFAEALVLITDRPALLRAHPELYECGVPVFDPIVAPADGNVQPRIRFKCEKRIELSKLEYLFELYLTV